MFLHVNHFLTKAIPLFVMVLFLGAASCIKFSGADQTVVYYHLTNNSEYRLRVVLYDFWDHRYYLDPKTDSVLYFEPGQDRDILVVCNVSTWRVVQATDTVPGLHVLRIYRDETFPVQKNYLLRKYWDYSVPDTYKYLFGLTITDDSFVP